MDGRTIVVKLDTGPELRSQSSACIYVGDLSKDRCPADSGEVVPVRPDYCQGGCETPSHDANIALVTFLDVECAKKAVAELHGVVIKEGEPPLTVRPDRYDGLRKKEKTKKVRKGEDGEEEGH